MGKSFIELKATMDDINEEKEAAYKKAGKLIATNLAGPAARDPKKASVDIENLLKDFNDAEKYRVMKYAFLAMC